jgi:FkbM family methyltransferase
MRSLNTVLYRFRLFLRARGFDVVRYALPVDAPIDLLSHFVRSLASTGQPLALVQVGAHDGVMQDPVRKLVVELQLSATLVEPLPDAFTRLAESYSGVPNVRLVNAAIAGEDGNLPLFRIREGAPFGDWAQGIASFNRSHFLRFDVPGLADYVDEISVPCMSWQSLAKQQGVRDCDVLVVDTEGMDDEIVRGALNAGLRPAIIQYEWCHLAAERRSRCKSLLLECGYQFVDTGIDTIAVQPQRLALPKG